MLLRIQQSVTYLNRPILFLSLAFGVFAGFVDAVLDYLIFYEDSFLNLLVLDVPSHEVYTRSIILLLFLSFGIILALNHTRQQRSAQILQKALKTSRVLSEFGDVLVHAQTEQKLLDDICRILVETGDYCFVWVGLLGDDHVSIVPATSAGHGDGYLEAINVTYDDAPSGWGPSGIAVRYGRPEIVSNIRDYPGFEPFRDAALARGLASTISIPLRDEGKILGVLGIYSDAIDAFDDQSVQLLVALAEKVGYGINSLRNQQRRLEAETELARQKDFFEQTFVQSALSTQIFDHNGQTLRVNPQFCQLFGVQAEDVENGQYNILEDPEVVRAGILPSVKAAFEGNVSAFEVFYDVSAAAEELDIALAEEKKGWFWDNIYPVFGADGEVEYVVIQHQEITERKQSEMKLRDNEARYKGMFDDQPAIMLVIDPETSFIIDANRAAHEFYGYADLTRLKISDLNLLEPEEIKKLLIETRDRRLSYFNFQHRLASGEIRDVEAYTGPVTINGRQLLYSIVHDITLRKQAERNVRMNEARMRLTVQNMPVILGAFDENKNIIAWNQEGERVTGFSAVDLIDNSDAMHKLYPNPDERERILGLWDYGDYHGYEWQVTAKNGQQRTISWSNISNRHPVPGWASWAVGIDVTERVQATDALQRANRDLEDRVSARTRELSAARAAEHHERVFAEALRDIANALSQTFDFDDVLDLILLHISNILPHEVITIRLLHDGKAVGVRAKGYHELGVDRWYFEKPIDIDSIYHLRHMFNSHAPMLITNTRLFPHWPDGEAQKWVGSYIGAPIVVEDEVIGFISVKSVQPDYYDDTHLERLKTLTNQAAIAVRNAHAFERARDLAALKERQHLARELHDAVTQTLFSANVLAKTLLRMWQKNPDEIPLHLGQLNHLTRGALAEMRTLLLELRPEALLQTRLDKLLSQLADAYMSRTAAQIDVEVICNLCPPPDVKITIYRIAQEALNNAAKHARATHIAIYLCAESESLTMRISDNGRGFDISQVNGDHMGLNIMEERASTIAANLSINSTQGEGTNILIDWCARVCEPDV